MPALAYPIFVSDADSSTPIETGEMAVENGSSEGTPPPNDDTESSQSIEGEEPSREFENTGRNFRRRRQQRQTQSNADTANGRHFTQDYIVDKFSRYVGASLVIGFVVAFILLSWQWSQIHRNDMEMFKLKESINEKSQQRHENFREGLIHKQYEETRECHSTINLCLSGRDGLVQIISNMKREGHLIRSRSEEKENFQEGIIQQGYEETRECSSTLKTCESKREGLQQNIKDCDMNRFRLETEVAKKHQRILELEEKLVGLTNRNGRYFWLFVIGIILLVMLGCSNSSK